MNTTSPPPDKKKGKQKPPPPIDPRLLEILVCPATKGPLHYDAHTGELISPQAGLAYPVRDGIPIMLIDEARRMKDSQET